MKKPSRKKTKPKNSIIAPELPHLREKAKQAIELLKKSGFTNVAIIGYRNVPLSEEEKYNGEKEVPIYFHDFSNSLPLGALVNWANEDIKRLVKKEATN